MNKKTIIFQKYDVIFERQINDLFSFDILYHNKFSLSNVVLQEEYSVIHWCRNPQKIKLIKNNGKEYLVVDDDFAAATELDNFLSRQNDSMGKVTAKMLFDAIIDHCHQFAVKMCLSDIYCNYNYNPQVSYTAKTMWTIGYIDEIDGDYLFLYYTHGTQPFYSKRACWYREKQIVGIKLQEVIVDQVAEYDIIDICAYSELDISDIYIFYEYQRCLINIASDNYQTPDFLRNVKANKVSEFLLKPQALNKILNLELEFIGEYVRNISIECLLEKREVHLYDHTKHSGDNTEDWTEVVCTDYEDSYLNSLLRIEGQYCSICVNNTPKSLPGETYFQDVERVTNNTRVNALKQYSSYEHMHILLHECSIILSEYHKARCSVINIAQSIGYELCPGQTDYVIFEF